MKRLLLSVTAAVMLVGCSNSGGSSSNPGYKDSYSDSEYDKITACPTNDEGLRAHAFKTRRDANDDLVPLPCPRDAPTAASAPAAGTTTDGGTLSVTTASLVSCKHLPNRPGWSITPAEEKYFCVYSVTVQNGRNRPLALPPNQWRLIAETGDFGATGGRTCVAPPGSECQATVHFNVDGANMGKARWIRVGDTDLEYSFPD